MSANTNIDENMDRFRGMKEEAARDMDRLGTDDVPGVVEIWRDGDPLLLIISPQIDRDLVLDAAYFAIPAFAADRAIVMLDAHFSTEPTNPKTGKPWEQGEMQKACDEDGACSLGIITDCLLINDVTADSYKMATLPYHVNKEAKQVHWQDDKDSFQELDEGATVTGRVPDTLRAAFEETSPFANLEDDDLEISPQEARQAEDAAAILRIIMGGYGVLFSGSNREWLEAVQDMLKHNPLGVELQMENLNA